MSIFSRYSRRADLSTVQKREENAENVQRKRSYQMSGTADVMPIITPVLEVRAYAPPAPPVEPPLRRLHRGRCSHRGRRSHRRPASGR